MVVPAMEAQGQGTTIGSIDGGANTTSSLRRRPADDGNDQQPERGRRAAWVRGAPDVPRDRAISAGHGRKREFSYGSGAGDDAASCFVVRGSGEDGVRDALRGALRSVPELQLLDLTESEWESIVPEDVVPRLADPEEQRRNGGAADVHLAVVRRVRYDAAGVLMTGCKKIDDGVAKKGDADADCSVCFDALRLRERGEAVELPGCAHAFHRRCISTWFRHKPTCPLCRGDVVKHLDPELQKQIAEFTDDDAM